MLIHFLPYNITPWSCWRSMPTKPSHCAIIAILSDQKSSAAELTTKPDPWAASSVLSKIVCYTTYSSLWELAKMQPTLHFVLAPSAGTWRDGGYTCATTLATKHNQTQTFYVCIVLHAQTSSRVRNILLCKRRPRSSGLKSGTDEVWFAPEKMQNGKWRLWMVCKIRKKNYSASIGLAKIPPTPSGSAESCSKKSAVDVPIIRRGIAHLSSLVALYIRIYIYYIAMGNTRRANHWWESNCNKKSFPPAERNKNYIYPKHK